jgi:tight adherence protein B
VNTFIILGIVAFVLLVGLGLALTVGEKTGQRDRALNVILSGKKAAVKDDGKDKMNKARAENIARKLKDATQEVKDSAEKKKGKATIHELMEQAGVEAPVSSFWIGSVVAAVATWLFLTFCTDWPAIAVVLSTAGAFLGMPRFFLRRRARRRQKKFLSELPDALDGCVRLLQAGMPMTEAIAMVSREYEGPLRDEMLRIYDNQKIGVPLGQAALETARRIPLTEVHMFATALQIQSETGSSLSEVLTNLSNVIRARFRLRRKIDALSSEAKASAAIIGALPFLVSGGLYLVNPGYMDPLFHSAKGHVFLAGCGFWMSCGILIMKQMINFKI